MSFALVQAFDFAVNVVSILDLVSSHQSGNAGGDVGVQALRVLRVLRIVRMANHNPAVRVLVASAAKSFTKAIGCYFMWGTVTFCFAILGNQLFWGIRQVR